MKDGIHPEYYETQVTCGCGNKFTTRSTRKELKVDICNVCHPVLHGQAEVRRHGRPHREVQEQVRRRRLRQPQARQEVGAAPPEHVCMLRADLAWAVPTATRRRSRFAAIRVESAAGRLVSAAFARSPVAHFLCAIYSNKNWPASSSSKATS